MNLIHSLIATNAAARLGRLFFLLFVLFPGAVLYGAVVPQESPIRDLEFRKSELHLRNSYLRGDRVVARGGSELVSNLGSLGVSPNHAYLDLRTGRWGTILSAQPLLPGDGVGNSLEWSGLFAGAPTNSAAFRQVAWEALIGYLHQHRTVLGLDLAELTNPGRIGVHEEGSLIQIHAPRQIDGVPVRDSHLTVVINHGNLVLFGAINWHDIDVPTEPTITLGQAYNAMRGHTGDHVPLADPWMKPSLEIVPVARGGDLEEMVIGDGLGYRLVWVVRPAFRHEMGRFEALVDAHDGELIAFQDTNHYGTGCTISPRTVVGGVYPEANDGLDPNGTEQAGWPMPFAFVTTPGGTLTTSTGGNVLACIDGVVSTALSGPYLTMNDNCGAINESTTGAVLDLGTSGGDDCTVPAGSASLGNTHSSRSGFYEMGRIIEMAQAQLPDNTWLQNQLTSNMNINQSCNAFWSGTVNFYRSGNGCNNTGEIAGVFDHEWGHGMDDNDVQGSIANPGEGIADIYASLRLSTSCIGRSFFQTGTCGGYGDTCLSCTGIRDIDWNKRASQTPHDIAWIDANCGGGPAPCGGGVHCEGTVYSEAVWDLYQRDLQTVYGMDLNTAREVTSRLTFLGSGLVTNWYQCNTTFGGCNADGGYLNYLAADDDNGNIADGTPHMQAIFDAFNRHTIACDTPILADSGCTDTPTVAVNVTATAVDRGVQLTWDAPAEGPTPISYKIFRAEGVLTGSPPVLEEGRVLIGEVAAAEGLGGGSFNDLGLLNGRDYSYEVYPMGPGDGCFGPANDTVVATPTDGANLAIDSLSVDLAISGGDGDTFLDNCETGSFTFVVSNIGTGNATNVTITGVTSTTHPGIDASITFTPAVGTLASCALGATGFDFIAQDLSANETVEFEVCFTSDELSPTQLCATLSTNVTESDFEALAFKTFAFNSDQDGWTTVQGTYARNGGTGSNGNAGFMASSAFLDDQCDQARSPLMRLSSTSAVALSTNIDIEDFDGSQWWDRCNIGIVDGGGVRTTIVPTDGRAYNASGGGGSCGIEAEQGWAGSSPTWANSVFDATQVGDPFDGQLVQLDLIYGTDALINGAGCWFDQVTVTDLEIQAPDAQSDFCSCHPIANANAGSDQTICLDGTVTIGTPAKSGHTYLWSPNGETTAQITVSPDYTAVYTVEATSDCGSDSDSVTVFVDYGVVGMEESFEDCSRRALDWASDGLWHFAVNSVCPSVGPSPDPGFTSPVTAAYYGQSQECSFDTGEPTTGRMISAPIFGIDACSTLSFNYWRDVGFTVGQYDISKVEVRYQDVDFPVFYLDSSTASAATWGSSGAISLGRFAPGPIYLIFTFDSVNAISNDFVGWFVDDIVVTGSSSGCTNQGVPPPAPTFVEADQVVPEFDASYWDYDPSIPVYNVYVGSGTCDPMPVPTCPEFVLGKRKNQPPCVLLDSFAEQQGGDVYVLLTASGPGGESDPACATFERSENLIFQNDFWLDTRFWTSIFP